MGQDTRFVLEDQERKEAPLVIALLMACKDEESSLPPRTREAYAALRKEQESFQRMMRGER